MESYLILTPTSLFAESKVLSLESTNPLWWPPQPTLTQSKVSTQRLPNLSRWEFSDINDCFEPRLWHSRNFFCIMIKFPFSLPLRLFLLRIYLYSLTIRNFSKSAQYFNMVVRSFILSAIVLLLKQFWNTVPFWNSPQSHFSTFL